MPPTLREIRALAYGAAFLALCFACAPAWSADAPAGARLDDEQFDRLIDSIINRHRNPNDVRKAAILKLGKAQIPPEKEDFVIRTLLSVTWERDLRETSERLLLEKHGRAIVPHLIDALGMEDALPALRTHAASLLGRVSGIPDHELQPLLDALTSAMSDDNPIIRQSASQALVQRGLAGMHALIACLEKGDRMAAIAAATELKNLASPQAPETLRRQLFAAEKPLTRRIQSSDSRERFASLLALDRLWSLRAEENPEFTLRRIEVLCGFQNDDDPFVVRHVNSVLEDLRYNCPQDWLRTTALTCEAPAVRIFAAETLKRLRAFDALPDLNAAIEREKDSRAKKELRRSQMLLSIAERKSSGNKRLQKGMFAVAFLGLVALLSPIGREWWLRRVEERERRQRANREFMSENFGLDIGERSPGYSAIAVELRTLDLRPESPSRDRLAAFIAEARQRFGLSKQDLRSEFPFKTDFVHALLRRTVGHNRTDSLFPEGPLLSIEAPGRGCVAVSDEDFSEVEVAKKSHLAVTLLEEDLRPKLKNAAAALGFLVERWKLPVLDIQTARPETKITLLSNILVGDDALERLQLGVEEIGSRFAFATPPKIARMPSIEKMLLWIALGKQDRSMSAFEDFVLQAVVKPLRMGTMDAFARLLRPSQEAEEEMFRIYADRITRLLSEYSTRNEVCEELVMKGKDHVASLIFDQTGGVHVQDREAIGELMKTGPVGRVMRKEAEWNRQRRIEIEKNATFENTRLIRRLLELSRLDEEGREAFRSHVEDHITREDRSCFDVGGLSARRIRELLNGAADAVAPHLPAVWADEPAATA